MVETRTASIRVVVVDDQPLERTGYALILDSDDEIDVVGEAGNGSEALRIVAQTKPDVLLIDVRMPVMGGIEAIRIIADEYPATRVIVLTTFDLDEYAFGSLEAGASAFLLKSTTPFALVDAVKTVAYGSAIVSPSLTGKLIEHYLQSVRSRPHVTGGTGSPESKLDLLTPREREVLTGIVGGLTNAEIGSELRLAQSTVKSYVNSIFSKLGLRDRVHAVILGYEVGLDLEPFG